MFAHILPTPLDDLIQRDKRRYEKKHPTPDDDISDNDTEYFTDDDSVNNVETVTTTTTTVVVKKIRTRKPSKSRVPDQGNHTPPLRKGPPEIPPPPRAPQPTQKQKQRERHRRNSETLPSPPRYNGHTRDTRVAGNQPMVVGPGPLIYPAPWRPQPRHFFNYFTGPGPQNQWSRPPSPPAPETPQEKLTNIKVMRDDEHVMYIGLRVYVNTGADPVSEGPVEIVGRIKESSSDDEDEDDCTSLRGRSRSRSSISGTVSRSSSRGSSPPRRPRRRYRKRCS